MSNILTNGVQFSDQAENIVGKEEIACYEQFLLFPQCFQKLSVLDALTLSQTTNFRLFQTERDCR